LHNIFVKRLVNPALHHTPSHLPTCFDHEINSWCCLFPRCKTWTVCLHVYS